MAESLTQAVPNPKPTGPAPKPANVQSPAAAKMKVVPAHKGLKLDTPPPPPRNEKPRQNVPDPVSRATLSIGHLLALASFLFVVLIPVGVTSHYLFTKAADQYVSRTAFSVRQMKPNTGVGLGGLSGLAGFAGLTGSTDDDGNILFDFLRSHEVVAEIDTEINLRSLWSVPVQQDPFFSFDPGGAVEELHRYWAKMVRVRYDGGAGIISVEARAFSPDDAQLISSAITRASDRKINKLSQIAQADAMLLAGSELDSAKTALAKAGQDMADFRNRTQIIDPAATLQIQMGLLSNLQAQLADVLIRRDLLVDTTRSSDSRLDRLNREVKVIEDRLAMEKKNLGVGFTDNGSKPLATLFGEYQDLEIQLKFATETYAQTLAAYELARGDARRQSRYLAAHISPTLPESAEHPQKLRLVALVAGFLLLAWVLSALTISSLRERK